MASTIFVMRHSLRRCFISLVSFLGEWGDLIVGVACFLILDSELKENGRVGKTWYFTWYGEVKKKMSPLSPVYDPEYLCVTSNDDDARYKESHDE